MCGRDDDLTAAHLQSPALLMHQLDHLLSLVLQLVPRTEPRRVTVLRRNSVGCRRATGQSQPICGAISAGTPWPSHSLPALRLRAAQWSPSARYSVNVGGLYPLTCELVAQPPTHFSGMIEASGDPNFAVKAPVSVSGVHGGCGAVVGGAAVVSGAV